MMNLQVMDPGEEQAEELVLLVEELAPAESLVKVDHEDLVEQLLVDELLVHRLLDTEDAVDKLLVDKIFVHKPLDADLLHKISYLDSFLHDLFINKSDISKLFLVSSLCSHLTSLLLAENSTSCFYLMCHYHVLE